MSLPPRFRVAVGLGANLGDAGATLRAAAQAMNGLPWTSVAARSSLYRSAPVNAEGPDYLNAVVLLHTGLGPLELLHALQALEATHGRQRSHANAPRTLDLDMLWYERLCLSGSELQLPHPRWNQRAFVLEPLAEVLGALPASFEPDLAESWAWPLPSVAARAALVQSQGIERLPGAL